VNRIWKVETEDTTSTEPDKVIRSDNTTHRTTGKQFYIGKEGFGFEGGGLGKLRLRAGFGLLHLKNL
jgi:hypothetical protein